MNAKNLNWPIIIFLITYQLLVLIMAPFYFYYTPPSGGIILAAVAAFLLTGISITAGYHRLYSHRSYKANRAVEIVLMFLGTMAGQGSVLRWANDHRFHHNYVDTDRDPYSIKKGFWHAHMLWLFEKRPPINEKIVADLMKNKLVVFQDKHYGILFVMTNLLVSLLVGYFFSDILGALYLVWWVRLFAVHHCTWFINSLAHTWGSKSYSGEFSAVDNYLISLLTFGEGYHNYHHFFATDYRNGIRWYHFDPTKWLIWSLNKLGLTKNLRRIDQYKIQKQVLKNDKDLLLNKIKQFTDIKTEVVERKVQEAYDSMMNRMVEIKALKEKYMVLKKEEAMHNALKDVKFEMNQMKEKLYQDFKNWQLLFDRIMKQKPLFS
jgi:stearoyl-CoA desaturase (delta-9 desaturase)